MEYPDQSLFEPDTDEKEESKLLIPGWLRITGSLLAVLGLLYLSGVHQGFLFRRTPPDFDKPEISSEISGRVITLPLRVFILVGGENLGSLRNEEDVDQIVRNTNSIWNQANISLTTESVEFVELSDEQISLFLRNPGQIISNAPGYDPNQINVFLLRSLSGINGIAFGGLRATAVADFTTNNDFRTFAHEIGHVLGLGHTQDKSRLMSQGSNGSKLSEAEIESSRSFALGAGY